MVGILSHVPTVVLAALWAMACAGMAWYIACTAAEITYVTMADGRRQERRLPLFFRMLLPFAPAVIGPFRKATAKPMRDSIARKLAQAGYEDLIKPEEFLALRVLSPAVLGTAGVLLLMAATVAGGKRPAVLGDARYIVSYIMIYLLAGVYPASVLSRLVAERHRSIIRALPFVMDLLTLSVEAGLDFMLAIKNIIARRNPDPIGEELGRMMLEVQLGATRRDAMQHFSDRVGQPDVQSLVLALIQADEMGVSIGTVLRVQSDQIRQRRFTRAEKLANEAPVKMLFPLIAFIFPAVFLVLMGPMVMQILRTGF